MSSQAKSAPSRAALSSVWTCPTVASSFRRGTTTETRRERRGAERASAPAAAKSGRSGPRDRDVSSGVATGKCYERPGTVSASLRLGRPNPSVSRPEALAERCGRPSPSRRATGFPERLHDERGERATEHRRPGARLVRAWLGYPARTVAGAERDALDGARCLRDRHARGGP